MWAAPSRDVKASVIRAIRPKWSIVIVRWTSTGARSKRVQFDAVAG